MTSSPTPRFNKQETTKDTKRVFMERHTSSTNQVTRMDRMVFFKQGNWESGNLGIHLVLDLDLDFGVTRRVVLTSQLSPLTSFQQYSASSNQEDA